MRNAHPGPPLPLDCLTCMEAITEPLEGNRIKLSVAVDEAEIVEALDGTFRKLSKEVRVPGFRPGKAPRRVLEARIGATKVREETIRDLLPDYYERAVRDQDLEPISVPEIDVKSGNDSGPLEFEALFEVRPHIAIPGYKGLLVTVPSVEVTMEEVSQHVDRLRAQMGTLAPVDRPASDGDHLTIDLEGRRLSTSAASASGTDSRGGHSSDKGSEPGGGGSLAGDEGSGEPDEDLVLNDYVYELGKSTLVDKLDDALRGANAGDTVEFDTELNRKAVHFKVLLKQIQEKILPDATDEWAHKASEFDTLAELREDMVSHISLAKRAVALSEFRHKAVEALAELVQEDAPEPLVDEEVERRRAELDENLDAGGISLATYLEMRGVTLEDVMSEIREAAVLTVKEDLALRALAEAEGIEADDARIDEEISRTAQQMRKSEDDVRALLARGDRLAALRWEVRKTMAARWLYDHTEIVDEEGHAISYEELKSEIDQSTAGSAGGKLTSGEVAESGDQPASAVEGEDAGEFDARGQAESEGGSSE